SPARPPGAPASTGRVSPRRRGRPGWPTRRGARPSWGPRPPGRTPSPTSRPLTARTGRARSAHVRSTWTSPPVAVGAGPPGVGGGKAGGGVEAGALAGPDPVVAPRPPLVPGGVLVVSGGTSRRDSGRESRTGALVPLEELVPPVPSPSEERS